MKNWLALIGAIYPRIEKDALNRIFFPANERASLKHDNQSYFKACLKKSINLQEKERKFYNFLWTSSILLSMRNVYMSRWVLQFQKRCNKEVFELDTLHALTVWERYLNRCNDLKIAPRGIPTDALVIKQRKLPYHFRPLQPTTTSLSSWDARFLLTTTAHCLLVNNATTYISGGRIFINLLKLLNWC